MFGVGFTMCVDICNTHMYVYIYIYIYICVCAHIGILTCNELAATLSEMTSVVRHQAVGALADRGMDRRAFYKHRALAFLVLICIYDCVYRYVLISIY